MILRLWRKRFIAYAIMKTARGCEPSEDVRLRSLVVDLNNYIIIIHNLPQASSQGAV